MIDQDQTYVSIVLNKEKYECLDGYRKNLIPKKQPKRLYLIISNNGVDSVKLAPLTTLIIIYTVLLFSALITMIEKQFRIVNWLRIVTRT